MPICFNKSISDCNFIFDRLLGIFPDTIQVNLSCFNAISSTGAFLWRFSMGISHKMNPVPITILFIIQLYLIYELIKIFIVIVKREKYNFDIAFPFKQGKYMITDGGNSRISRMMNYHFHSAVHKKNKTNNSMLFATDIVRIDNAQQKFLPPQNEDYPIFGEKVFSPMSGVIFKIANNISDNIPFSGHYPYNTGNTIVIRDGNKYMLLGHLKMGSIMVNVGDSIRENDHLAAVGNSGYSERPHLHMQLIESNSEEFWYGTGISIRFGAKNLFKNRIIEVM